MVYICLHLGYIDGIHVTIYSIHESYGLEYVIIITMENHHFSLENPL